MIVRKEEFTDALIKQYSSVLEAMIVESESVYRSQIDFHELDFRLQSLIRAARVDGLEESTIWNIVQQRIPEYIHFLHARGAYCKVAA